MPDLNPPGTDAPIGATSDRRQMSRGPSQWLAAREHELGGDQDAAAALYRTILDNDPTQAFAWHQLSALASLQDRYRDARIAALSGTGLAIEHRRWRVLPYLTRQLLGFDERDAVRRAIAAADWSDPAILSQSAVLAQQLWLADDHRTGLDLVERTLPVAPESHLLHYVRGCLLRHLGRTDEATAAFERSIAIAPHFAEAHWALAHHSRSVKPGARIPRICTALRQVQRRGIDAAYLGYALFKELDAFGKTDAAWAALTTASSLVRKHLHHDPASEQEMVRSLIAQPGQALAPPLAGSMQDGCTPVFIVGMPRTGTTLLERVLGNHGRIASAGELNAFDASVSMALDRRYAAPPTRSILAGTSGLDVAAIGRDYMQRTRALYQGRSHLIDKNPQNIFNAGLIARAMPRARILCLLRNPVDTCFSNYKTLFPGGGYAYSYDLAELASHWHCFRQLVGHWRTVLPGRFMTVRYESLVTDPFDTTSSVMTFLGLEMEPDCIDITRNPAASSTASSSQVRRPIHRDGIGAWKRYRHQLHLLEGCLRQSDGCVDSA